MLEVSWFLFVAASLLLIATPGQDMLLVMSRSIKGPVGVFAAADVKHQATTNCALPRFDGALLDPVVKPNTMHIR